MQKKQLKSLKESIDKIWRMFGDKKRKRNIQERRITKKIYGKKVIWMDR